MPGAKSSTWDAAVENPALLGEAIDRFMERTGGLRPNGHRVVRLASRRDLDVIALADDRLRSG